MRAVVIKSLFLIGHIEESRQTAWERVKNEPGQPTIKGVKRFFENARWLKDQTIDPSAVSGIPGVNCRDSLLKRVR